MYKVQIMLCSNEIIKTSRNLNQMMQLSYRSGLHGSKIKRKVKEKKKEM